MFYHLPGNGCSEFAAVAVGAREMNSAIDTAHTDFLSGLGEALKGTCDTGKSIGSYLEGDLICSKKVGENGGGGSAKSAVA